MLTLYTLAQSKKISMLPPPTHPHPPPPTHPHPPSQPARVSAIDDHPPTKCNTGSPAGHERQSVSAHRFCSAVHGSVVMGFVQVLLVLEVGPERGDGGGGAGDDDEGADDGDEGLGNLLTVLWMT